MKHVQRLREEMIYCCRKVHEKGLVAATDGNLSCRLEDGRLLITPSGRPKGEVQGDELLILNADGSPVSDEGRPSSEIRMHLAVYELRPDVGAVVHAHPPMLTAFTLAGVPFQSDVLPEVWLTLGPVPTAPYATPSTEEVPDSLRPLIADHQAMLLERHGSLTFGRDLREAYLRLEKLEHAATTLYHARMLGGRAPAAMSEEEKEKLERAFGKR